LASPRRGRVRFRIIHCGGRNGTRTIFLRVLRIFPVTIIPPFLQIHSCIIWGMEKGSIRSQGASYRNVRFERQHDGQCPKLRIECRSRVINIPVSYSGGPGFKSRAGDVPVAFHSPSKQMPGQHLKLGHDRFIPYTFQFIIHMSFFNSTLYILS
jgi:hypothetical protein